MVDLFRVGILLEKFLEKSTPDISTNLVCLSDSEPLGAAHHNTNGDARMQPTNGSCTKGIMNEKGNRQLFTAYSY